MKKQKGTLTKGQMAEAQERVGIITAIVNRSERVKGSKPVGTVPVYTLNRTRRGFEGEETFMREVPGMGHVPVKINRVKMVRPKPRAIRPR